MAKIAEPGTGWRESVAADEPQRHEALAAALKSIQIERSAKYGAGRALHRKMLMALPARLDVLPDLPDFCRHGLFAAPASYDARVRLSNGGMDVQANSRPDIRGFAVSVKGVSGRGALGTETDRQDYLLINQDSFSSPTSDEFIGIVAAAAKGQGAVLLHFLRRYGVFGGLSRLRRLAGALGKPFRGFAGERFNSVAPIACGPFAVRVLLEPCAPSARGQADPIDHMRAILAKGPIEYDFKLQFYVDDARTPIEDPTVVWPDHETPIVTVARLTLAPEPATAEARAALAAKVEKSAFDPWAALEAHRPLGEIMRARKVAYYASQQARKSS